MTGKDFPDNFRRLLDSVTAKRPRTVIEHIRKHGQVTTEELQSTYGYNHPPRAIRDVRELGIPIVTVRVTGSDGRSIAAYRFGDPEDVRAVMTGRTAVSAGLKKQLVDRYGAKCNIYREAFPMGELQVDHRVPFEIAGDDATSREPEQYMLLCASANRAKSWSCENCQNWSQRDPETCKSCYWAFPESYTHVAMREIRRLDILWRDEEVPEYERLRCAASESRQEMPDFVKNALRRVLPDGRGKG